MYKVIMRTLFVLLGLTMLACAGIVVYDKLGLGKETVAQTNNNAAGKDGTPINPREEDYTTPEQVNTEESGNTEGQDNSMEASGDIGEQDNSVEASGDIGGQDNNEEASSADIDGITQSEAKKDEIRNYIMETYSVYDLEYMDTADVNGAACILFYDVNPETGISAEYLVAYNTGTGQVFKLYPDGSIGYDLEERYTVVGGDGNYIESVENGCTVITDADGSNVTFKVIRNPESTHLSAVRKAEDYFIASVIESDYEKACSYFEAGYSPSDKPGERADQATRYYCGLRGNRQELFDSLYNSASNSGHTLSTVEVRIAVTEGESGYDDNGSMVVSCDTVIGCFGTATDGQSDRFGRIFGDISLASYDGGQTWRIFFARIQ